MAACLASLFWRTEATSHKIAALFYVFAYLVVSSIVTMPTLIVHRTLYLKEYHGSKYSLLALLVGNAIGTLPVEGLVATVFSVSCYWAFGLRAGNTFYPRVC
jgi:ABC-type multidrug transport system permease subunit